LLRHLLTATVLFAALAATWAVVLLLARRYLRTPPEQDLPACGSCARGTCAHRDNAALDCPETRTAAPTRG